MTMSIPVYLLVMGGFWLSGYLMGKHFGGKKAVEDLYRNIYGEGK